jgi:hypothetical protein
MIFGGHSECPRHRVLPAVPSFTSAKYCRKVCIRKHASTCSEYGSLARRPDTQCRIREGRRCKRGNPDFEGGLHSFNHAGMSVCTAPFSALLCAGRSLHSKDRVVGTNSCWNGLWCTCEGGTGCVHAGLCAILCFCGGSKRFTMAHGWRELCLLWVIRLVCTGGMEGVAIRGGDEVPAPAHETYYAIGV